MKIGLIRHFKVKQDYPPLISAQALNDWFEAYDQADIEPAHVDLQDVQWQRCYASDLSRAIKTARTIYGESITIREELREVSQPRLKSRLKLPFLFWGLYIRMLFLVNHSSLTERNEEVARRVKRFVDETLAANENTLIVSHGWVMLALRKELLRRGFKGPNLGRIPNGKLFIFELKK